MPAMLTDPSGMVLNCSTVKNTTDDTSDTSDSGGPGMLPNEAMDPPEPQGGCWGHTVFGGGGGGGFSDGSWTLDGGYVGDDSGMGGVPGDGGGLYSWHGSGYEGTGAAYILSIFWGSDFGGDPGGPGDGDRGDFAKKLQQAVANCVKQLFGVDLMSFTPSAKGQNGSFTGVGPNGQQLSVTNDVNKFSVSDLNVLVYGSATPPKGRGNINGYTAEGSRATKYFWGIGYAYRSFSLSTNYSGSDLSPAEMLGTQAHELGHSLAGLLKLVSPNYEDPYGGKMQDCVNQELLKQAKPK